MNKTIDLIKNVVVVFCLIFVFCFATKSQAASVIKTDDDAAKEKIASIAQAAGCRAFACRCGDFEVTLYVDPTEYNKVFENKNTDALFDFLSQVVEEAEPKSDLFTKYWAVVEPWIPATATPKPEYTPEEIKEKFMNSSESVIKILAKEYGYVVYELIPKVYFVRSEAAGFALKNEMSEEDINYIKEQTMNSKYCFVLDYRPEATAKPTVSPEKVKEILNNTITEKISEVARKFGYVVVTEQEGSEVYFYFENNEFAKVRTSDTDYYFGIIGPDCWHTVFKDYYAVSVEDVMNYVRKSSRKDVFVIERTDKLTQKEVEDYEYYTNRQKKYVIQNDEEDDDDVDVEAVKVDVQNIDAKNISSTDPTVTISIADLETSDTEAKNIANQQPKVTVQTKADTATTSKATVKKPEKKTSVKKVVKTKKTKKTKKIKNKKAKNKKNKKIKKSKK